MIFQERRLKSCGVVDFVDDFGDLGGGLIVF